MMDFIKSVLPPLPKLPKLKKIRNWNGGSLLSLNQFPSLPPSFGLGSFMPSSTGGPPPPPSAPRIHPPRSKDSRGSQQEQPHHRSAPHHYRAHRRNPSDISIISKTVSNQTPTEYGRRDNFGLYALKCDRSAAKRGILLNLPRKLTQAVVGDAGRVEPGVSSHAGTVPDQQEFVHEKFSPCKRPAPDALASPVVQAIRPPPRRRKRSSPHATLNASGSTERSVELGRWEKNSSELFRIVERESASAARARSAGGVGLVGWSRKPEQSAFPATERTNFHAPLKTRSVDNLLAIRYHRRARYDPREQPRSESDSESDVQQVRSLRIHPPAYPRRSARGSKKKLPANEQTTDVPVVHFHRRQASDDIRDGIRGPKIEQSEQGQRSGTVGGASNVPSTSTAAAMHFKLQRATDFSIENNSDEIEVRFRSHGGGDEEAPEQPVRPTDRHPLPSRVAQLRRGSSRSSAHGVGQHIPKTPPSVVTRPSNEGLIARPANPTASHEPIQQQPEPGNGTSARCTPTEANRSKFVPLAEVLKKSIDCGELKRKWINEFLEESDANRDEVVGKKAAAVPKLESGRGRDTSEGSVDIFHRSTCDFGEFDELFPGALETNGATLPAHRAPDEFAPRKSVKLSEQITYIDRSSTTSNLCFSSSSFSCASIDGNGMGEGGAPNLEPSAPPPPPPPPPPASLPATKGAPTITLSEQKAGPGTSKGSSSGSSCKSTVIIQDYSSKQLQRVRYLSSPSPSRSSTTALPEENLSAGNDDPWRPNPLSSPHTGLNEPSMVIAYLNTSKEELEGRGGTNISTNIHSELPGDDGHHRQQIRRANNNIVLPLHVIKTASAYDMDGVFTPLSGGQLYAGSKLDTGSHGQPLERETELTKTTAAGADAVKLTASASARLAGSPPLVQHQLTTRGSPAMSTSVLKTAGSCLTSPKIEHIPYNQHDMQSYCATTYTTNATGSVVVSKENTKSNKSKQLPMSGIHNRVFIIGDAFDHNHNGDGLHYQHDLPYLGVESSLSDKYQSLPSVPPVPALSYPTNRLPETQIGFDVSSRQHFQPIGADLRVVKQHPSSAGGGSSSPFSIIPDYDEYYNEEGVIII